MSKDILLEIGTEEIPAHYMPSILSQVKDLAAKKLDAANITYTSIRSLGTPRRIALLVAGVAEKQADVSAKNKGPSVKIAFDAEGKPTKAAMGFARGQKIAVEDLVVEDGYVYANVTTIGAETAGLLPDILKDIILSLSFPKSMIWGSQTVHFVRPLRWLVALFGTDVIPFSIANVQSGKISRGHRFLGTGDFEIPSMAAYVDTARDHFLIVDPEERKQMILAGFQRLADEKGGTIMMDEDLLEEVIFLVEYPTALCGEFDKEFLQLPEAAIITPMKDHQRYFPMHDKDGNLMNLFLTVRNGDDYHLETVQHGNERVLRALLDDAKFFFEEDNKNKHRDRVGDLQRIVFQDGLGTLKDKAERLSAITVFLNHKLDLGVEDEDLKRVSALAKTDLLTQMVAEFTELQGVMGCEYAKIDGEKPEIATAIYEQYLPRFAGDDLPQMTLGKILGLADKLDTITGSFSLGLIPTGSQDPFALRRQTIGCLHILMEAGWNLNLQEVFAYILSLLDTEADKRATVIDQLTDYFTLRLKNIFQDEDMDYHIIDCVLASDTLNAAEAAKRADALIAADIRSQEDLLQAFTRVGNMIKDAEDTDVDPNLFETEEEKALYAAVTALENTVHQHYAVYDIAGAIQELAKGVPAINNFLDNVLVMHENPAVKENRMNLLTRTFDLIRPIGDIKKLN
ncbi:glycine--tRNA ligase subunit beta [uncultured Megasphaera sp.]|uniref:glycine--tRNA ligase subunit beta n=1 Tax=uncultured Megasphaera sp. TaxID=165188 RepID=UPI00266EE3BD|nr:glycine--tRNA ligase subunit beta [uncultured Megasphaera sp.]